MRSLCVLAVGAAVVALAMPAAAASPPKKEIARLKREVAALRAKVNELQRENKDLEAGLVRAFQRERALVRHVAAVDPCPITHPNGSEPPGSTFGSEFHGNGSLWVGMWTANIVVWERQADGSIDAKFGWWRAVRGRLTIEGRRLDGPAPPLRANIPSGYGEQGFQATGVIFPTEGCWEVTGRVGSTNLTFVTLVLASSSS